MSFLNKYPYTDFHELNLDFVLDRIQKLTADMEHFKAINEVTYRGQWNITEQYTAWSVVTNGTTGYLATQPVPSGIAITNTDYWVVIDDFSDVQAIQAELDQLKADVSPLLNKKYLFIGDSFAEAAAGWVTNLVSWLGLSSDDYFVVAEGGIGYCHPGNNTSVPLKDTVQDYLGTLTADQVASITDVIVIAGENDIKPQYRNGPAAAAVAAFYPWLYGALPNVQRILVGFNGTYLQPGNATYGDRSAYRWEIARDIKANCLKTPKVCFNEGIQFSLTSTVLIESDGVHPNANGYINLSLAIMDAMNGGEWDRIYESTAHNLEFISCSKWHQVKVPANTAIYTGAITINSGMTTIGTWSDLPWYPKYNQSLYISLQDVIIDNDASVYYHDLVLRIAYNGTIQIFNPGNPITVNTNIFNVLETVYQYDARQ